MIKRLIDFSLDNRFLVIALWLLLAVAGIASLSRLPIDAVPDVTNIQVQVLTNSAAGSPLPVASPKAWAIRWRPWTRIPSRACSSPGHRT